MKKKKIEDIFSSIENFSSVPPPELWTKIEEKLDKPKKKKVTAIWWSLAASLLIGLAITSGLYFNSNEKDTLINNKVVLDNQENNSKTNTTPANINTTPLNSKAVISVAGSDNSTINKASNNNQESTKTATTSINKKEKPSFSNNTNTLLSEQNSSRINNNTNNNRSKRIVSSKSNNSEKSIKDDTTPSLTNNKRSDLLENKIEEIALNSNRKSSSQNDVNNSPNKTNTARVDGDLNTNQNKEIALNANSEKNSVILNDSLNNVQIALELQQLENRLNKKEDKDEPKTEKELLKEKWSIGLYAGVASSQSYGNKKSLGNEIESKQNTGYGIKTNYKLNKKWAVSSGLKINELGQSVANVSYYNKQQNTLSSGITNDFFASVSSVEYISTNSNYVFSSDNGNQKAASNSPSDKPGTSSTNNLTGNLDQQLQYLEMPLEISYSILSTKKTAIMLNTGGFIGKLISNEIFLDGNSIGGNLDVNNFVYGSKLSSTLQYEVLKQTRLFVEPGLNYYINPLKTQSFNQFQWGLNFGVNFGF